MDGERRPLLYGNGGRNEHAKIVDNDIDRFSKYTSLNAGSIQPGNSEDAYHSLGYPNVGQVQTDPQPEVKVYTRRFYILAVFSVLTLVQSMVWNTWGPISQSAKQVFNWTDGDIALLANWGPIAFIISLVFFSWVLEVKGLRWSCLSTSFLVTAGTALRCITFQQPWANWLIHAGQLLNGLGGPVAMAACTVISSRWFPPHQRTTSTSIGNLANSVGAAVSFIIGPLIVPQHEISCNSTVVWNTSYINSTTYPWELPDPRRFDDPWINISLPVSGCPNSSVIDGYIDDERDGIKRLMYIECGITGAIFLAILLYYPSTPPQPPSITASIDRVDFKTGLKSLLRHKSFWLISTIYGVSLGVQNCWMSVLDVNLSPLGVTQNEAGWMGFYSIMASTLGSLIISRFADIFSKHMKLYLLVLYLAASGIFVWMALMAARFVPYTVEYLYIAVIGGNVFLGAGVPLLYELSCELTYPIPEAVTTGALALYNNVTGFIFLFLVMIPNKDKSWANWCLVGSVLICIPVLLMLKENYNRLDIDIEVTPPEKSATSDTNKTSGSIQS